MKHATPWTFAFIAFGMITLANPTYADQVGPYYATPSWDQKLPASTRFIVLSNFNSEAVLDRESGLVWERAPLCTNAPNFCVNFDFQEQARRRCNNLSLGGRVGWRLPTIQEMLSLVETPAGGLPPGHPFQGGLPPSQGILTSDFWTDSAYTNGPNDTTTYVWVAYLTSSSEGFATHDGRNSFRGGHYIWCVRGGQGINPQ